jgi:hypothetical protein
VESTTAGPARRGPETSADRTFLTFLIFVAIAAFLVVISWPLVWSFDLWVLKDRSSLLNVDYLMQEHRQLGVDTFYSYGLFPILIQHVAFAIFGRGAGPVLALSMAYLVAVAAFCARLRRHLPPGRNWTLALFALSPIMLVVTTTGSYCFVILSILFALLFVIEARLDIALAVVTVGCVSVPSLPIVLGFLLIVAILIDWVTSPVRNVALLARQLLPGVVTYAALVALLTLVFGWPSVVRTLTPISQLGHYHVEHWGGVATFLKPGSGKLSYYIGNRPLWWIVSTIVLFVTGIRSIGTMVAARRLDPSDTFVALCLGLHTFFFLFAYGAPHEHIIYDPVLVAGVLVGLAQFPAGRFRVAMAIAFVALGIISDAAQVKATVAAWRHTHVGPATAGFYANRTWAAQWASVLTTYDGKHVLMLSYATGVHHYFPQIASPDVWTLDVGEMTDQDLRRVLAQIDVADVIVQDLTSPDVLVDTNADIQRRLDAMCLVSVTADMQIWVRRGAQTPGETCRTNPRRFAHD